VLCGPELPQGFELLPEQDSAPSIDWLAAEFDGQLAQRVTSGSVSVELRWPASPQPLYATAGEEAIGIARLFVSSWGDGPWQLQIGEEVEVDFPPAELGDGMTGFQSDGTTSYAVFESSEPFAQFTTDPVVDLDPGCAVIQFEVFDNSHLVASFGWDLSKAGEGRNPLPLDPLIIESRTVDAAPTEAAACESPDTNPNRNGIGPRTSHATPAAALADFVALTERWPAGYVELAVTDRVVYGLPFDGWAGQGPEFTVLITVEPTSQDDQWAVTHWTSSGC
jgi:hypothetical protein